MPEIGIDVGKRHKEIRKIFIKIYGHRCVGYDLEELIQKLYLAILVRNKGTCPFDPSKASFSKYVCIVALGVVRNHHRKESKHNARHLLLGDDVPEVVVDPVTTTESAVIRKVLDALETVEQKEFVADILRGVCRADLIGAVKGRRRIIDDLSLREIRRLILA